MVEEPIDFSEMAKDFNDADDGEVFGVDDGVTSCFPHAWSTHAEELEVGSSSVHRFDELGSVHFTGSFARGDEDVHGSYCRLKIVDF
jgi:hypothetical protein